MESALIIEFMQQQWLLLLALMIVLFMLFQSHFGDKLSGYASIAPEQAVRMMNDGAFVLDVRSIDEYRGGHLTGAKNLSVADLPTKLDSLEAHKAGPTIVYCESGLRSARACGILRKAGFEQLHNLSGGINAWRGANLPIVKQGKKK
ncbi:MAG: rhodanese-like domain-containing protein [Gammaproteobacteria bacterium]|nr:rhodanese-like domain-containing protein [Gammaproteobacteria bacterium]